jgi:hypothetical protein
LLKLLSRGGTTKLPIEEQARQQLRLLLPEGSCCISIYGGRQNSTHTHNLTKGEFNGALWQQKRPLDLLLITWKSYFKAGGIG